MEQRIALTRSFLIRLSQNGRARAFACYHGQDTANPHVHVMFFDRDSETGRRVQRMSEKGSTERIRRMWQETCNNHLERGGFEDRIDHRSRAEIEAEKQAERLDAIGEFDAIGMAEIREDGDGHTETQEVEHHEVSLEAEDDRVTESPVAEIENAEPAPVIDYSEVPFDERSAFEKVGYALRMDEEMEDIQRTLWAYNDLTARLPRERDAFEHHTQSSALKSGEAAQAQKRYIELKTEFEAKHKDRVGGLMGFEITLGGVTVLQTRRRRLAKMKRDELAHAEEAMQATKDAATFHKNARLAAQRKLKETNERLTPLDRLMRNYGSAQEAENLAADMKRSRDFALDRLQVHEAELLYENGQITGDEIQRLARMQIGRQRELQNDSGSEGFGH